MVPSSHPNTLPPNGKQDSVAPSLLYRTVRRVFSLGGGGYDHHSPPPGGGRDVLASLWGALMLSILHIQSVSGQTWMDTNLTGVWVLTAIFLFHL